jgi:hypothetical protein
VRKNPSSPMKFRRAARKIRIKDLPSFVLHAPHAHTRKNPCRLPGNSEGRRAKLETFRLLSFVCTHHTHTRSHRLLDPCVIAHWPKASWTPATPKSPTTGFRISVGRCAGHALLGGNLLVVIYGPPHLKIGISKKGRSK